jgi:hypothetical protein
MPDSEKLDNKTLAILMVIAELLDKKSDTKHILGLYDKKLEQARDYLTSGR